MHLSCKGASEFAPEGQYGSNWRLSSEQVGGTECYWIGLDLSRLDQIRLDYTPPFQRKNVLYRGFNLNMRHAVCICECGRAYIYESRKKYPRARNSYDTKVVANAYQMAPFLLILNPVPPRGGSKKKKDYTQKGTKRLRDLVKERHSQKRARQR